VFKAPYVIGKLLNGYHYFSSYRRQIGFSVVYVLLLCVKTKYTYFWRFFVYAYTCVLWRYV